MDSKATELSEAMRIEYGRRYDEACAVLKLAHHGFALSFEFNNQRKKREKTYRRQMLFASIWFVALLIWGELSPGSPWLAWGFALLLLYGFVVHLEKWIIATKIELLELYMRRLRSQFSAAVPSNYSYKNDFLDYGDLVRQEVELQKKDGVYYADAEDKCMEANKKWWGDLEKAIWDRLAKLLSD